MKKVADEGEMSLTVKKGSALHAISPRVGKIIQVTFRTGEGRKMRTDDFLVTSVDQSFVWLDEIVWNGKKSTLEPKRDPFGIALEKVHFIMDGDLGIWPTSGKKRK